MPQDTHASLNDGQTPGRSFSFAFLWVTKWALIVLAGLALVLYALPKGIAIWSRHSAKQEAIEALSQAKTLEDCKNILKGGTWLEMRDGSWIAIRYQDAHGSWSMAVALDSKGSWYDSDEHFCARFMGYHRGKDIAAALIKEYREKNEAVPDSAYEMLRGKPPLGDIEQCPDLPSAIQQLLQLGFKPMPKPEQ